MNLQSRLSKLEQSRPIDATEWDAEAWDALAYIEWLRQSFPPQWSTDARHIRLIAEHLDAVQNGQIDRLAIHLPPRHGKTETVTVRLPAWWMRSRPFENVLLTGYNERFARRLSRKARSVAQGHLRLDTTKQAEDEWATVYGAVCMSRGVGSPPTGTGFGLIDIDDPVRRREDAESEFYREKVWDWYTDDLYTRLEPDGVIVLVMTLWHEDDLGARAVASEPGRWAVLKLPAFAEEGDALGRVMGEALWPERFHRDALLRIRDVLAQNEGLRSWEALYQQNPTPREGSFFKVSQLRVIDQTPTGLHLVRAWDTAATPGGGDYTAGVLMSKDTAGQYYVLDVVRGQWSTEERNAVIRRTAEHDGNCVRIRGQQEPGSAGVDAAAAFVRLLAGFSVKVERATGSKEVRADPFSSQVNAGNVSLLRGEWNRAFSEEMRTFPNGRHDDMVDAAADAFNMLAIAREALPKQLFY